MLNAGSVVKSVQRGNFVGDINKSESHTININSVNVDKSILSVEYMRAAYSGNTNNNVHTASLTNNSIIINNKNPTWAVSISCDWQVIEFY